MAATDAKPVPQRNVAYRHYFAIRKADGTIATGWAGQDTTLSKDGAAYVPATNEATEIGASGTGYIDLTAAEMDFDAVLVSVAVTTTDALPYIVTLFPEQSGDIRVDPTANTFGLSTFNPATDTVANVTTVANNSDMRGTDGANTIAPDNGQGAAVILWGDGTGAWGAVADTAGLSTFNPATDTVANVTNTANLTNAGLLALEATSQQIADQTDKMQFNASDALKSNVSHWAGGEILQAGIDATIGAFPLVGVRYWQGSELTGANMIEDDGSGNSQFSSLALENGAVADVSLLALESSVQDIITIGGTGPWTTFGGGGGAIDANIIQVNGVATSGVDDFKADVSLLATETAATSNTATILNTGNLNWTTAITGGLATASQLDDVETKVDGIAAKTINLPADPASESTILTAGAGWVTADVSGLATLAQGTAIQATTDNLDTMIQAAGGGLFEYTTGALVNTPSGPGGGNVRGIGYGPAFVVIPDSGTRTDRFYLYTYDENGESVDADALPTVSIIASDGTDLSGNFDTVQDPAATGAYYVDYTTTVGDSDTTAQVTWQHTQNAGADTFLTPFATSFVDFAEVVKADIVSVQGDPVTSVDDFKADLTPLEASVAAISILVYGDKVIDSSNPAQFQEIAYEAGTGNELARYNLRDVLGQPITSIDTFVASKITP